MRRTTHDEGPLTDEELNPPTNLDDVCRYLREIERRLTEISKQLSESNASLGSIKATVERGNIGGYLLVIIGLLILLIWQQG
jgi:hypothetical protein